MKTFLVASLLAVFAVAPAFAAEPAPAKTLTPQQQKMKDCSASAKSQSLKGDERRKFMSGCLKKDGGSGTTGAAAKTETVAGGGGKAAQQQKMKDCSAQAKSQTLSGDARKKFMSTCLKG
jgi:hypothetical protein